MNEQLSEARRILRAPIGAIVGERTVTPESKESAWQQLQAIARSLREVHDDAATSSGMRDWIAADLEIIRNPAATCIMTSSNVRTSATDVWVTLPFYPSTIDEDSVEGLATLKTGLEGSAIVRRLLGTWSGEATLVLTSLSNTNAFHYELTMGTSIAGEFLERFCTPAPRTSTPGEELERVVAEIDATMRAIEIAVAGGAAVSASPLRDRGIAILEFHPASASKFALHKRLLTHLLERGAMKELMLWSIGLRTGAELSGLIVIAGPSPAIAALGRVYHLPEAESFVAEMCEDDWSLLNATATISDTPASGEAVNLPFTEVRLMELLKLIRTEALTVGRIEAAPSKEKGMDQ